MEKQSKKLSPEEFERVFRVTLPPPISVDDRITARKINDLFDVMRSKHELAEVKIFEEANASEAFGAFLKNVLTCPESVFSFCREKYGEGIEA